MVAGVRTRIFIENVGNGSTTYVPVRGHSYCKCDRNFAKYSRPKKKTETIETEDEYLKMIEKAKNPPFIVVKSTVVSVKDFEPCLKSGVKILKDLQIRNAVKIIYYPNGEVEVFEK